MNAKLVWKASLDPRKYDVFSWPSIDYIARVVYRHEIEAARRRLVIRNRRYRYTPSSEYIQARTYLCSFNNTKNIISNENTRTSKNQ